MRAKTSTRDWRVDQVGFGDKEIRILVPPSSDFVLSEESALELANAIYVYFGHPSITELTEQDKLSRLGHFSYDNSGVRRSCE